MSEEKAMDTQSGPDWLAIPYTAGTYDVRSELRQLGCVPDTVRKLWMCHPSVAEKALKLSILGEVRETWLSDSEQAVLGQIVEDFFGPGPARWCPAGLTADGHPG